MWHTHLLSLKKRDLERSTHARKGTSKNAVCQDIIPILLQKDFTKSQLRKRVLRFALRLQCAMGFSTRFSINSARYVDKSPKLCCPCKCSVLCELCTRCVLLLFSFDVLTATAPVCVPHPVFLQIFTKKAHTLGGIGPNLRWTVRIRHTYC